MALFKKGSTPKVESKKTSAAVWISSIVLVVILALVIGYLYYDTYLDHDNILDQVSVAGVDVSGMSKEEAYTAVRNATASTYSTKPMTITVAEDTHTISPSISGAKLDVEAAVDAAHAYGRQGFVFRRKYEQYQLSQGTVHIDIIKYLHLDEDAIRVETDRLSQPYNCTVVQSTFRVEGALPDESQETAGDRALIVTLGTPGYQLDTQALYDQVIQAYNQNDLRITADCAVTKPDPLDLEAIAEEHGITPVDAQLNENTFEITDHKLGFGFVPSQVRQTLYNGAAGQEYTFAFHELEPDVSRADIEAKLFADVLSEYTSESASVYNRDINLKLSCQSINGLILLPGEVFDYNTALGERTPEAGYRLGNTYSGMETIQTYGGGICQTSSTLYYCAMLADLEIVTRTNHSFLNTYVPFGMDATVNWGTLDFRFKNNLEYPIKIEAYSDAGDVTVRILGTDYKDYYVDMEYVVLGVYGWKTVEQEMPADNPKGYKDGDVITSPYTGYKVQTYRCKYDKATSTLISREPEAYSAYTTRDKVVCKIVEQQPANNGSDGSLAPDSTTPSDAATEPSAAPSSDANHSDSSIS